MKKQDLEVGTIYGSKYGRPYLLLSTRIWQRDRRNKRWIILKKGIQPKRGTGWTDSSKGVLVLEGGIDALRRFDLPDTLWDELKQADAEDFDHYVQDHTSLYNKIKEQASRHDLYLSIEDYRRWPGTYDKVQADKKRENERFDRAYAQLDQLVAQRRARAEQVESRLLALLQGRYRIRTVSTILEIDGWKRSGINGLHLTLDQVEELIILAERGQR